MKTPMQEMYDQLKASKKDEYGLAFAIDMLLENEEVMLQKEKEAMCEFQELSQRTDYWVHYDGSEDCFKKTFNAKEK